MNFKTLSTVLISALTLSVLTACDSGDVPTVDALPGPLGETCSLQGVWSQCGDNGDGTSGRVRLTVAGSALHETIDNYNSADCSGASIGQFLINAVVTLGSVGRSTAIAGGTDVDLVPDVDFAGCGVGQPAYTVIKFNDACNQFHIPDTGPSCNPASRGSALGAGVFSKE